MDNEKEISFGAFDSELMHQEIFIPEGFTATIDGNKIILKKIEGEDEKVRKALIRFHKSTMDIDGIKGYEIVAWLEKQGEHKKFRDSIQVGDEVTRNSDGVIVNMSQLKRVAKPAQQKLPIEKLPEEMKTIGESLGFTTQEECDEYNQIVSDLIMSGDNMEEQKSNVGNKKLTDVNHEYFSELLENDNSEDINDYAYQVAYCMSHDWLKDNATWEDIQQACKLGAEWKEKHLNNSSTNWSKDDEQIKEDILYDLNTLLEDSKSEWAIKDLKKEINWLQSLRPKNQWKPSDEQVEALYEETQKSDRIRDERIVSLYNDLKKL